jgi:hypothetical protein
MKKIASQKNHLKLKHLQDSFQEEKKLDGVLYQSYQ